MTLRSNTGITTSFAPDGTHRRGFPEVLRTFGRRPATQRPRLRYEHIDLGGLSDRDFAVRFDQMGDVISDAMLACGENEWATIDWQARRARIRWGTSAYMVWDGDVLAGFLLYSSFPFAGRTCIHMKTGYVRPAYQSGGIGFSLSVRVAYRAVLHRPLGEFLLVSDMLNPIVVAGWIARFPTATKMLPADFGRYSAELVELGSQVAAEMYPWAEYDQERCVLHGKTVPRSGVIEVSGDPVVDEYFMTNMDPTNGDTILYLAEFDHPTVMKGVLELVQLTGRVLDRRLRKPSRRKRSTTGSASARHP